MQPQSREIQCTVMVAKPQTMTRTVTAYEMQPQTREIQCTVMVPKTMSGTRTVTTYKMEAYPETVNYTVCVPQQVQKEIQVQVCRMVPKTIQVCVPVTACAGTCSTGRCGRT